MPDVSDFIKDREMSFFKRPMTGLISDGLLEVDVWVEEVIYKIIVERDFDLSGDP